MANPAYPRWRDWRKCVGGNGENYIDANSGKDNIEELENCFTRLRVNVKNPDLINEDLINHVPNSGINRNGNNIQIIFGMKVAEMRDKVENAIEKEQ